MQHPQIGERVYVRPTNPSVRVQRGDGLYGQFLPADGQECIWDPFLHCRLAEGVIEWRPLESKPMEVRSEPPKPKVFVINTEDPNWRTVATELLELLQPKDAAPLPSGDTGAREGGG